MKFTDKLTLRQRDERTCVCVGIDPVLDMMPARFRNDSDRSALLEFSKWIADQTAEKACAFKPNVGFFLRHGSEGIRALELLVEHIQDEHPNVPVIVDFKANDIGSSAEQYAAFAARLGVDATTVNPYPGSDSVFEFLKVGFAFVLCRTSNKSAMQFQDLRISSISSVSGLPENAPLFMHVAQRVAWWRREKHTPDWDCGLVVGATCPDELKMVVGVTGNAPLLIPGVGKQQGDLEGTLKAAAGQKVSDRLIIINSSSGIIFNDNPATAAMQLRDQINALLPQGYYE